MKNAEAWGHYRDYTRDITELTRRLAFGAAAICWIFRSADGRFPPTALWALLSVFLFFGSDLAQALLAAVGQRNWLLAQEEAQHTETGTIEGEYHKPASLDTWPYRLFRLKLVFLALAYAALAAHVVVQLRQPVVG